MRRVGSVVLLALLTLVSQRALTQEPLRLEIVTGTPQHYDPIVVRVTNLTTQTMQLALPLYFFGRRSEYRQVLASAPLDIEEKMGKRWVQIPVGQDTRRPNASPQIEAGQTKEFQFGVAGAGEYRVRVWYVISPPELGPPPRAAKYASVVSSSFKVN